MSDNSRIEWTEATWNPVTGCTKVSPGCDHCYAERITERFHGKGSFEIVKLHEDRLDVPLRWRKPRRVFVNSMSDLFHDDVPDEFIARVFAVMAAASWHTYQVLTKRHGRMRSLLNSDKFKLQVHNAYCCLPSDIPSIRGYVWPLPAVWLGVSVETQKWADIRIPALLDTPAAVRWLSCEPLLGPLELGAYMARSDDHAPWSYTEFGVLCMCGAACDRDERCTRPDVDWVVVGGESGPYARRMDPEWALAIRDQVTYAQVPFFFKQWGGPTPKANGRELDGRTWDEYPARAA